MADPSHQEILALVRICSWVALRDESRLRAEFQRSLAEGISIALIREAVLQTYLFAGYAATINAFVVLNEFAASDQEVLQEEPASLETWRERGEKLCRQIYGSQYENLVHNMKRLHPDLADWMLWEGYGKVLSRPFLSPLVRELMIVAMTAVLKVERQFYSHVRGALNVGASPEELNAVLQEVKSYLDDSAFQRYQSILNSILSKT